MIFQNITNKYRQTPVQVYSIFILKPPYQVSINIIYQLCATWNMRLLQSDSNSSQCKIAIKYIKFNALFGVQPVVGQILNINGTESFIKHIIIQEIKNG